MDTRCNYLWSYMFILTSATINTTSFNNIPIFRFCYPNDSINVVYKKYGMKYWQVICGWPLETVRESPPTKCWRQNIQYVTLNVIYYSVATISWRTANTTKAFINQSLGFSKQFRTLSITIHKPIQHNDKKHPITTIFGMHTHNTRLSINTNMV